MPFVTVLMSAYNAERYLGEAIESILKQTFQDFEFIVIDDGSTDGTAAILADYQRRDKRIQIYRQENQGLAAALNTGLDLAQGKYIARMDADDISLPQRLAKQVAFMETHPEVGVCGTWARNISDRLVRPWIRRLPVTDAAIRCHLFFGSPMCHPTVILRRDLFTRTGLRYDINYKYGQDYELWSRAANYTRMENIPEVLLHYRVHSQQVGNHHSAEQLAFTKNVWIYQLKHLIPNPSSDEIALHLMIGVIGRGEDLNTKECVFQLHDWLRYLQITNHNLSVYPEPEFSQILAQRWLGLCYHTPKLGFWIWYMFWQSRFSATSELHWLQKIKFATKSGWFSYKRRRSREKILQPSSFIALIGRRKSSTCGITDYCKLLSEELTKQGYSLQSIHVPWEEWGWLSTYLWLLKNGVCWQGKWVLIQYTALSWSNKGLPVGLIVFLLILKLHFARVGVVFHDVQPHPLVRYSAQYLLRWLGQWVLMRTLYHLTKHSILNVPVEQMKWLPSNPIKATFIPVGSLIPSPELTDKLKGGKQQKTKSVAVFGVTDVSPKSAEIADIVYIVKKAAQCLQGIRLVLLGRGSREVEATLQEAFKDVNIEVAVHGVLTGEQISLILSECNVLLMVRQHISTRRSSVSAAIACGLPVVGYRGNETGHPVTKAGVMFAPEGDREALATALLQLLNDEQLWQHLRRRNFYVRKAYLSWDSIAEKFLKTFTLPVYSESTK